jgi:hypothetical protein
VYLKINDLISHKFSEINKQIIQMENNLDINEEAKRLIQEKEATWEPTASQSLGKVSSYQEEEPKTVMEDIGWIRVKLETLPSLGVFYPQGTEITIRAASAAEIVPFTALLRIPLPV